MPSAPSYPAAAPLLNPLPYPYPRNHSLAGIVPLKSDHTTSALDSATIATADLSSPPPLLPRQASTDEVRRLRPPISSQSFDVVNNSRAFSWLLSVVTSTSSGSS